MSMQVTVLPLSAKQVPATRPTYPVPITVIRIGLWFGCVGVAWGGAAGYLVGGKGQLGGRLTQWLECLAYTEKVGGSNPSSPHHPFFSVELLGQVDRGSLISLV